MSVATARARMSPFLAPCGWISMFVDAMGWRRVLAGLFYYYLTDCRGEGDSFGAGAHGVCGVLDIRSLDNGTVGEEEGAADSEMGVWAWGCYVSLGME